jgi:hypothetical protein
VDKKLPVIFINSFYVECKRKPNMNAIDVPGAWLVMVLCFLFWSCLFIRGIMGNMGITVV